MVFCLTDFLFFFLFFCLFALIFFVVVVCPVLGVFEFFLGESKGKDMQLGRWEGRDELRGGYKR